MYESHTHTQTHTHTYTHTHTTHTHTHTNKHYASICFRYNNLFTLIEIEILVGVRRGVETSKGKLLLEVRLN